MGRDRAQYDAGVRFIEQPGLNDDRGARLAIVTGAYAHNNVAAL